MVVDELYGLDGDNTAGEPPRTLSPCGETPGTTAKDGEARRQRGQLTKEGRDLRMEPGGKTAGRSAGLRDAAETAVAIDPDVIARMMVDIYEKDFDTRGEVHPGLYEAVRERLRSGVEKGLEQASYTPEEAFKDALRRSADVFAAFKVHRCQNDMAARMVNADGSLRSFKEWKEAVAPIASHQCGRWLRTEYDTAVLRAQQAADWKRFEEYADVLPNLEWMPSTSATPGADHQVFWHTIRPVNDPFWSQHRPGDRWNCKRSLEATDAPVTEIPRTGREIAESAQAGLENNPGTDGRIFSETHPYIAEAYPGAKEAVERIVNAVVDLDSIPAGLNPENNRPLFRKCQKALGKELQKKGRLERESEDLYTGRLFFGKNEREHILEHLYDADEIVAARKIHEILMSLKGGKYDPLNWNRPNASRKFDEGIPHFTAYTINIDGVDYVLKCEVKRDKKGIAEYPYSFKKKENP